MSPTINSVLKDTKNLDVHEWKLKNGKTVWITTEDMVEILSDYYNQEDYSWPSKIPDSAFLRKSNTIFNSFRNRYSEVFIISMLLISIDLKLYPIFDNQSIFLVVVLIYAIIAEVFNVLRKSKSLFLKLVPVLFYLTFLIFLLLKKPI